MKTRTTYCIERSGYQCVGAFAGDPNLFLFRFDDTSGTTGVEVYLTKAQLDLLKADIALAESARWCQEAVVEAESAKIYEKLGG